MKTRHVLVVALAALAFATAASANSTFYYQRTSLTNSVFDVLASQGYWLGDIRAGSGSGTDACQHNNWIPLGDYNILFHDDNYPGSDIQGRVWRLSDYHCSNGVWRTQLFVHSEETSAQGQSCGPAGTDYKFCWEGDHDYYSLGCVKLARRPTPSDLGRVDNFVHAYGMARDLLVYN